MTCPPYQVTDLSVDRDGWIKPDQNQDGDGRPIELTASCHQLLKEVKLETSSGTLTGSDGAESNTETKAETPLEELEHHPNLYNVVSRVIADVRRLGAPRDGDLRRGEKGEGQNNQSKHRRGRRNSGRKNGKVAQLEEQRKVRQQQELEQEAARMTMANGAAPEAHDDGAPASGFVQVSPHKAANHGDPSPDGDCLNIPVNLRLAAVFNSLRILIAVLRPMLDHARRKDTTLRMKHGPSIQKQEAKGKKGKRNYLLSKHVYCCVSEKTWKEIHTEYNKLLDSIQEGLSDTLAKRNSSGRYEMDARGWVAGLFDHAFYTDRLLVAQKSMGIAANSQLDCQKVVPETARQFHAGLAARFERDHDQKQELLRQSVARLQDKLLAAIADRFHGARLSVYGSCLSGLALEGSHDVDISVYVPELYRLKRDFDAGRMSAEAYEKRMRGLIYRVRDALASSFVDLFAITRARIPVIKGTDSHARNPYAHDGSLSFDLCFLNDIAVVNSSLLREYSLFDGRARMLMLAVKSFAKKKQLASAVEGTLSSYTWLNLVVFYLQCTGLLPVLQCAQFKKEHEFEANPSNRMHRVNGLKTDYVTKDLVTKRGIWECSPQVHDTSMLLLLYGFFNFYSNVFPAQTVAASIRFGSCRLQKTVFQKTAKLWRLCVEDPFETCDSHFPHDLGCHIKEDGQQKINRHLVLATKELEALLRQQNVSDDAMSAFLVEFLGPIPQSNNGNVGKPSRYPQSKYQQSKVQSKNLPHNHQNVSKKGKQTGSNRNTPKQTVRKQGEGVSRHILARHATKGNPGINAGRPKMNGQRGKNTNGTRSASTVPPKELIPPLNNPAVDKKNVNI